MADRILVLGASGFLGSRIVAALLARNAEVICAGSNPATLRRRFPACVAIEVDLSRDTGERWASRLADVDAVVNAAGVLRGDLDTIHRRGPIALFDGCAQAGVPCVIQLSALGAGSRSTAFFTTKDRADRHLIGLARRRGYRRWCVVRPSLVIGRGGASTALFSALAASPWPVRLGPGTWRVQPIHVADVARAVADLVEAPNLPPSLDLVSPEPATTDQLTASLRSWLGLPSHRFIPLPIRLLRLAAAIGTVLPHASFTGESLAMLAQGNTGEVIPAATVLGWQPRPLADALVAEPACSADLFAARMLPVRTVLLVCLALIWIGSGLVSLLLPPGRSGALLSGLGLSGTAAVVIARAGAVLDISLGAGMFLRRWRKPLLTAQLATMALYTVLATVALPALWLDPFGALLKNAAVLASSLVLLAGEARR